MRPRAWRIMMWTALAATVVLVGAAANPKWYCVLVSPTSLAFGVRDGAFECSSGDLIAGPAWEWRTGWNGRYLPEPWCWHRTFAGGGWSVGMHSRIPGCVTFAVCAFSAFMVFRTRRRSGHCPKCGYDLSGLPTAVCPECGKGERGSIAG